MALRAAPLRRVGLFWSAGRYAHRSNRILGLPVRNRTQTGVVGVVCFRLQPTLMEVKNHDAKGPTGWGERLLLLQAPQASRDWNYTRRLDSLVSADLRRKGFAQVPQLEGTTASIDEKVFT